MPGRARWALLAGAAAFSAAGPLPAQAVDYAGLQELLGEPVTTSVIGKPQRASDVPASVTIITHDEIERSPARNVPDLLKAYAGVDVNRWTAGQSDVAVRGGVQTYNARLLVLVNGRQVYLDHYGDTDWNLLGVQLGDIQQIELVRGPNSALFGFNAAAGVVNIVTVDPLAGRHATLLVEGGDHGAARVEASAALPIGHDAGLQLSGAHAVEDERHVPADLYQPGHLNDVRADQVGARFTATLDPATRMDLEGGWAGNRQLEFLPSQLLSEQRYDSERVGLSVDHDTGWGSVDARGYTNWLRATYGATTSPADPFYALSSVAFRNRITVAQGSGLLRLGDADTLRAGVEYRDNQLFSADTFSPRVGYRDGAVSTMLDLHPTERLALSLAARVDRLRLGQGGAPVQPQANVADDFDRTITEPSFNLGAVFDAGPIGQVRVNGGRGLQLPSLAGFGARVAIPQGRSPLPLLIAGDPGLLPTVSWSGEAGYLRRFGAGLRLEATFFFTHTSQVIATPGSNAAFALVALPTPALATRFANIGSFDALGVQAEASGGIAAGLRWRANYTWTRVSEHLPAVAASLAYAFDPRETTPEHVANLGVDYTRAGWSLAVDGHLTTGTRQFAFNRTATLELVPVPRAAALDAKLARTLTRQMSVFVAGENLGGARGAYGSPVPADRRVRAGLRLAL